MCTACLLRSAQQACFVSSNVMGNCRDQDCDCSGCNACRGDCRRRCRHSTPTARLSASSRRQDADWQDPGREEPNRQGARPRRVALLAHGIDRGSLNLPLSSAVEGRSVASRPNRLGSWLLAGLTLAASLPGTIPSASAHEARKRLADANALVSSDAPMQPGRAVQAARKQGTAKGPYYVDFRARTAASWGHAFVWYGKTSERAVEVAGLTPAGDTFAYVLGHLTWVPSETGASYGDLDPEYMTASYRVYLSEPDAKRVFAYIKKLQASSPVW